MRTRLLTLLLLVIFVGCRTKNKIPDGILPQDKMQAVLWDIMRADQFVNNYVLAKDTSLDKRLESIKYYQRVFALHQVDKNEFEKSYHYYRDHPALFSEIMDSLSRKSPSAPTKLVAPVNNDSLPPLATDTSKKPAADTVKKKDSAFIQLRKPGKHRHS